MQPTAVYLAIAATLACGALVAATQASDPNQANPLPVATMPLVHTIDERFQSFQIGMSHLTGGETWRRYDEEDKEGEAGQARDFAATREPRAPTDLNNQRLRNLTAALGPLYIRYGGTTSNSVYFQDNDEPRLANVPEGYSTILTRDAWRGALEFAQAVDAKVVTGFTVSDGVRDEDGAWTPAHAAPWLAYTRAIGGEIYAAELFNEPNAPEPGRMPQGQTADAFARDFAAFRSFMDAAAPEVKLAGPGVATLGVPIPMPALESISPEQYMAAEPRPKVDIVSYHFYGAVAERCAPPDSPAGISAEEALTREWLSRPDKQLQRHRTLRDQFAPGAPLWLTETGAAACGGPRWQPTFIDSFRYLDTQARLAKQGLDAIFTHALISGSNGVIDEKTFTPNASYWAALLWRRLMGSRVLDAGAEQPDLHLYAHCLRGTAGGVTLLALNLGAATKAIQLPGAGEMYTLTAPELHSKIVLLNGQPLQLGKDDRLPTLDAEPIQDGRVELAPTSINFIALPTAGNAACPAHH